MFNKIILNKVTFTVLAAVLFAMYAFAPSAQAQQQSTQQMQQLIQSLLQQVQALQAQLNQDNQGTQAPSWTSRVQTMDNLRVRNTPNGEIVTVQPRGSIGTLISSPQQVGGMRWVQVEFDGGVRGWSAVDFLNELPNPGANPGFSNPGVSEQVIVGDTPTPPGVSEQVNPIPEFQVNTNRDTLTSEVSFRVSGSSCTAYTIDWGDGNVTERPARDTSGRCTRDIMPVRESHSYRDSGEYRIIATVTQHVGVGSTRTFMSTETVTVGPVTGGPTPLDPIRDFQVNTNQNTLTARVSFTVNGSSCTAYTIDWGDGNVTERPARDTSGRCTRDIMPVRESHTYENAGAYTITATKTKYMMGGASLVMSSSERVIFRGNDTSRLLNLRYTNAPISGSDRRVRVRFDRPYPCSPYTIDWGDGNRTEVPGPSNQDVTCETVIDRVTETHQYSSTGRQEVTVTLTDSGVSESFRVNVVNDVLNLRINNNEDKSRVRVRFDVPDPCSGYVINWGDGNSHRVEGVNLPGVACPAVIANIDQTHDYKQAGRYVVSVNVLGTPQRSRRFVNISESAFPSLRSGVNPSDFTTTITSLQNSVQQLTAAIR